MTPPPDPATGAPPPSGPTSSALAKSATEPQTPVRVVPNPARPRLRPDRPSRSSSAELYLAYSFRDPTLLRTALTHSSLAHERHPPTPDDQPAQADPPAPATHLVDNEQLEFLGDAVLSLTAAEALLREFPTAEEGDLTRLRASIVSRDHLAGVARRLQLGGFLRLGRGEDRNGGRRKPALLADALEAVIAAIYLDGGLPAATTFVRRQIVEPALPDLQKTLEHGALTGDFKTALQERLQADGQQPRYNLLEASGPDHQRRFRIAVAIEAADGTQTTIAEADGTTKKQAQQRAAQLALQHLGLQAPNPSPIAPGSQSPA